ncbi:MAG TPA: DUF1592 domain-containing protein, partial [Humisphaera sp.]
TSREQSARLAAINGYFAKHCVACHGPTKKKADLVLHTLTDEKSMLAARKQVLHAMKMVRTGEMPPDDKPQPKIEESEAFAAAVNEFYVEVDRTAKPDPGRVTVRRLNRTEYNNTIRDLLGVEARPADDFPADDVGHGFDNIGDVLTLSPVLMERYLAAAETISQTVIALEPAKVPTKWQGAKYLEPAGPRVPDARFRPVPKGAVNTPFRASADGDYVLKTKVYGKRAADGQPVRVTLLMDGKELLTQDVPGTDEKSAKVIEHPMKLEAGEHRFAVQIANPSEGATELDVSGGGGSRRRGGGDNGNAPATKPATKPAGDVRTLYVEHIALAGPADTRPASHRRLVAAADPKAPRAEQTRQVLDRLATRAYRRPATKDEVERLAKLVEQTEAAGGKWEEGLQLAVQAVLTSPKFLFRLELDDRPEAPDARPVDDYALANRLSYFLWASMPDDELFALAAKGQLRANLEPQVRRMLADDKAKALVDQFAMQWLQLGRLKAFQPDTKLFPKFDESLRAAMQTETEMFLSAIIKEDRSVLELVDADFTFVNERLGNFYGIVDTLGNGWNVPKGQKRGERIPYNKFVRVSLPKDSTRGGLLTQASVLAVTSNPTRTSPVKRGKWVLEQILGTPPPTPPPDVPELKADGNVLTAQSLRQKMEQHRQNPACANCHARLDPMGFAFEHYDAVGQWRDKDGNAPVDAVGELPDGTKFDGAGALKKMLVEKRKDAIVRSLTEKLMTYGLGRGLEVYDDRAVSAVVKAADADGNKFSRLVIEIVKSDPFQKRRGLEQAADAR